ncbi:MAG: hypothetical protein LBC73_10445 [Oscillospiraceae bacterium]|jgi:hypothetical protein|nr:hypothetical protein [Oscillospiraceae bacterium]
MKTIGYILFCSLFFVLLLAPMAFMPWAENQLTENRLPAPAPELFNDEGFNTSFSKDAEDFLNDRFAGRTLMINTYSRLVSDIFGMSSNDKVVLGKDGWLFFHETMGDFDGSSALNDEEMEQIISYLLDLKQTAEERGQVFLIAIVPNKNSLYGEFLPTRYRQTNEPTNLDSLLLVDELGLIDFRSVFLETNQYLYYKTDSHWNGLGARIAAREIMKAIENKTGVQAEIDWENGTYETGLFTGDLGMMLFPSNPPTDEDMFFDETKQSYTNIGRVRSLDDMRITTESDGATLSVAMYRDSFANWLIPYFSNAYSNVYYTRQSPPPMDSSEFTEADVIIFQIVERRLGELLDFQG